MDNIQDQCLPYNETPWTVQGTEEVQGTRGQGCCTPRCTAGGMHPALGTPGAFGRQLCISTAKQQGSDKSIAHQG